MPFEAAGPTPQSPRHYREVLVDVLKDLEGRLLVGQPKVQSAEGAGEEIDAETPLQERLLGQTAFRFEAHRVDEGLVVGLVRRGRYGSHDQAMGSEEGVPDVPLSGYAPSSWFRFVLNLPDTGGHALLAVEDIGRACPVDLIIGWLGQRSREMAAEAALAGAQPAPDWFRLLGRQVADPLHLERLLRDGMFGEVTLSKKAVTEGRTTSSTPYKVVAPRIRDDSVPLLRRTLNSWRPSAETGKPSVSDADGAKQLAALVAPELVDVDWSDGQIAMPGSGGRPLKPSRLTELFTYEQNPSDRRSSAVAFYRSIRAVTARLDVLADADGPGLEWPEQVNLDFPEVVA